MHPTYFEYNIVGSFWSYEPWKIVPVLKKVEKWVCFENGQLHEHLHRNSHSKNIFHSSSG